MRRSATFGGETKGSAQRYFRAELPAQALRRYGWKTDTSLYALYPETDDEIGKDPRLRGWNGEGTPIIRPSSITTLRVVDELHFDHDTGKWEGSGQLDMAEAIRRARSAGQIVLCDIDDNMWDIPSWSPASSVPHAGNKAFRAMDEAVVDANMQASDGVMVSTEPLARIVEKRAPGVPVTVMRPGIDPALYKPKSPGRPLTVGWMGGMSHHLMHLRTMQIALEVLKFYDATFVCMGSIPGDHARELLSELPCKVELMGWSHITEMPEKFRHVDIGIIPRVPTEFNESQSITSGLQWAASGTPFLVSPSAEYEALAVNGAGKICRTIDDWRRELSDLLEHKGYRTDEAERAKECVSETYGLAATGKRYHDLFEGLLDGR